MAELDADRSGALDPRFCPKLDKGIEASPGTHGQPTKRLWRWLIALRIECRDAGIRQSGEWSQHRQGGQRQRRERQRVAATEKDDAHILYQRKRATMQFQPS